MWRDLGGSAHLFFVLNRKRGGASGVNPGVAYCRAVQASCGMRLEVKDERQGLVGGSCLL